MRHMICPQEPTVPKRSEITCITVHPNLLLKSTQKLFTSPMNEWRENAKKTFIHESKVHKIGRTVMTNHMYGVLCAIPKKWDRSVMWLSNREFCVNWIKGTIIPWVYGHGHGMVKNVLVLAEISFQIDECIW